jgi:hypothetical protein
MPVLILVIISITPGIISEYSIFLFLFSLIYPAVNTILTIMFFSLHSGINNILLVRYDSFINLFNLFRHTAIPAFLEMATPILQNGHLPFSSIMYKAFRFLSPEYKIFPDLNISSKSFLLLILSLPERVESFTDYISSLTVNLFLPLALLLANTFRPFFVAILSLKPCLFLLFLLLG